MCKICELEHPHPVKYALPMVVKEATEILTNIKEKQLAD